MPERSRKRFRFKRNCLNPQKRSAGSDSFHTRKDACQNEWTEFDPPVAEADRHRSERIVWRLSVQSVEVTTKLLNFETAEPIRGPIVEFVDGDAFRSDLLGVLRRNELDQRIQSSRRVRQKIGASKTIARRSEAVICGRRKPEPAGINCLQKAEVSWSPRRPNQFDSLLYILKTSCRR